MPLHHDASAEGVFKVGNVGNKHNFIVAISISPLCCSCPVTVLYHPRRYLVMLVAGYDNYT